MPSIFNVSQFDEPYDFLQTSTNRSDYDKSVDILTTTAASLSPFFAENTFPSDLDNDTALANFSAGKVQEERNLTSLLSNPASLPSSTLSKYVVPVVCVMGVVLNCLNLRVLSERCLKESPYTYLSAMAVLCLLNLLMFFIHNIFTNFLLIIRFNFSWLVFQFYIYYPTINICANSIMWLTTTLTIERFLFVCYPLWARAMCDRQAAKIKVCIIVALLTLLNIPRFFLYRLLPLKPNKYAPTNTTFRLSNAYIVISWINSALIQFIPLAILCVTNSYLVFAVHRARLVRKRMHIRNNMEAEWSREQSRLTITLIAIVFSFIVCIMPSALSDLHVAYAIFAGGQPMEVFYRSSFYLNLNTTSNFLVLCHLSFNFVLYSAFNDKFLSVLKRMFKRWVEALTRRHRRGNCCRATLRLDHRTIYVTDNARKPICVRNSSMSSKDNSQGKTSTTQTST